MASITSLAPELMQQILDLCDPPAHLNLALTCKSLQNRLQFILRYNRECHSKYRAVSDIHPLTIPQLLRDIVIRNDRVIAWHIRSIEIWGSRSKWSDWKEPIDLVEPPNCERGRNPVLPGPATPISYKEFFTPVEEVLLHQSMIDDLHMTFSQADITAGDDSSLKVLLIALSPRLRAVRFVRRSATEEEPSLDFETLNSLARVLEHTISREEIIPDGSQDSNYGEEEIPDDSDSSSQDHSNGGGEGTTSPTIIKYTCSPRTPGFSSVQQIAIGLSSRALPTSHYINENVTPFGGIQMGQVCPLFLLPNLKSVYIYGFNEDMTVELSTGTNETSPAAHWDLPRGCSAIEELVFDTPEDPERDPMEALIQACGSLKHLTFINGSIADHIDCDTVLAWTKLAKTTSHKTESTSVLWCGTAVHGYRTDMYYPDEFNDGFDVLTVSMDDVILCGGWEGKRDDEADVREKAFAEYVAGLFEMHEAMVLVTNGVWGDKCPWGCSEETLERVLLGAVRVRCWDECWDHNENDDYDEEGNLKREKTNGEEEEGEEGDESSEKGGNIGRKEGEEEETEERLPCGCLSSWGNHGQYPYYPSASASLYLECLEPWPRSQEDEPLPPSPADQMKRPFAEVIRFCKLWGVDVYTRTLPAPRVHKVAMPNIPSEKDLETSPWYKHPDIERIYFKPHKGLVDDCGNCGECDDCFAIHPPEAWKVWKEEDAKLDEVRRRREEEEEEGGDGDEDGEDEDDEEDGEDEKSEANGEDGEEQGSKMEEDKE
ncbi:hypothetical protein B0H66DRAFT_568665 [Apodospora peruviana]|uniref:F-box domain-containing protein n=1 Tax=Apodospora peruviana TaxID=516989 RepID=A0AAE0LYS7_9PEZI|nr:hypothetical protein B0H66DRAFT_568665 [Apodospora peruviana]